jgi:hypothetical protein
MSATLYISEESGWMPSSATFDIILEVVAKELEAVDPDLAYYLREPYMTSHLYLDLSALSKEKFSALLLAVELVFPKILRNWKTHEWVNLPDGTMGWIDINAFSQLKAILLLDPRADERVNPNRTILINSTTIWEAGKLNYDVVLEYLVADLEYKGEKTLSSSFLPYLYEYKEPCSLSNLGESQFRILLPAMDFLHRHYKDSEHGGGRISYSPRFLSSFVPSLIKLYEQFMSDKRLI